MPVFTSQSKTNIPTTDVVPFPQKTTENCRTQQHGWDIAALTEIKAKAKRDQELFTNQKEYLRTEAEVSTAAATAVVHSIYLVCAYSASSIHERHCGFLSSLTPFLPMCVHTKYVPLLKLPAPQQSRVQRTLVLPTPDKQSACLSLFRLATTPFFFATQRKLSAYRCGGGATPRIEGRDGALPVGVRRAFSNHPAAVRGAQFADRRQRGAAGEWCRPAPRAATSWRGAPLQ